MAQEPAAHQPDASERARPGTKRARNRKRVRIVLREDERDARVPAPEPPEREPGCDDVEDDAVPDRAMPAGLPIYDVPPLTLIPPGNYTGTATGPLTMQYAGRRWVALQSWRVLQHDGTVCDLPQFWGVDPVRGGRGVVGYAVPRCGHLNRDLTVVCGGRRNQQLSPHVLTGTTCELVVETVHLGWDHAPKAQHEQYSRVARVLRVVAPPAAP